MRSYYFGLLKKDILLFYRGSFVFYGFFFSLINSYLVYSLLDGGILRSGNLSIRNIITAQVITIILFTGSVIAKLSSDDENQRIQVLYNSWCLSKEKLFHIRIIVLFIVLISFFFWLLPSYLILYYLSSLSLTQSISIFVSYALISFFEACIFAFFNYSIKGKVLHVFISLLLSFIVFFGAEPRFLSIIFNESIPTLTSPIRLLIDFNQSEVSFLWLINNFTIFVVLIFFIGSIFFNFKKGFQ
jgi:hypothetical protein